MRRPDRILVLTLVVLAALPSASAAAPDASRMPEALLENTRAPAGMVALYDTRSSAPEASLDRFNPPGKEHEDRRRKLFSTVYTAVEERDDNLIEALGLRILLGEPNTGIFSRRLRTMLAEVDSADEVARIGQIDALRHWIETESHRPDFRDHYLSYEGYGGHVDPDFFIYTTPHAAIARIYGEVVFEIRPRTPRGVDLNGVNREFYDYYSKIPLKDRLHPRKALIHHVLDRDEYVIPSHIGGKEIVSLQIRSRLPTPGSKGSIMFTGRVQRRYERVSRDGRNWVDLVDRRGRMIARFSCEDDTPAIEGDRSNRPVPEFIESLVTDFTIDGRAVRILR